MHHATITKSGQLSVPAPIRHRWKARKVSIVDLGDRIVVSPLPEDPISALRGAFARTGGMTSDELRRHARDEERRIEEARSARLLRKPAP